MSINSISRYHSKQTIKCNRNDEIQYNDSGIKVQMQIISPDSIETGDLNDYSIVTKLDFYNNSFLFLLLVPSANIK